MTRGLDMKIPPSDPWPHLARQRRMKDSDHDGRPGGTVVACRDGSSRPPPVNMFRIKCASPFYIALRNVAQGARGTVENCDLLRRIATISVTAGKAALNLRFGGCARTDGRRCSLDESNLTKKLQLGYNLRVPARLQMRRVAPQPPSSTKSARARLPSLFALLLPTSYLCRTLIFIGRNPLS